MRMGGSENKGDALARQPRRYRVPGQPPAQPASGGGCLPQPRWAVCATGAGPPGPEAGAETVGTPQNTAIASREHTAPPPPPGGRAHHEDTRHRGDSMGGDRGGALRGTRVVCHGGKSRWGALAPKDTEALRQPPPPPGLCRR